jgi:Superfamily II DNA/RNA helicases, SNF2 family
VVADGPGVPGLLGSEKGFQRGIAGPIEKEDSDIHRVALNRRKAPFLLRRTKEEVATELPPKTITTTVVELEPAQRALYETIRAAQHEAVKAAIGERGLSQCGIVVLDALLKLRQVCCDPSLAPMASAKQVKGSAKLDALMELLHEAADGGRKVLVFSSFTQMLDRIAKRLEAEGIAFCVLTGETRKRDAVVAQFQTTATPVFLLSLKAGGVGLNLTAADTVIHYDPWWNPAAEDQATDRAHRIGQIRPVNVYRLIAKNTIEERIEILKARKAALAQAILSGEGDASRGWTAADIDHLFAA